MTLSSETRTISSRLQHLTRNREVSVLLLLLLTLLIVGAINRAFLAVGNLRDLLIQSVPTIIAACRLTLVIVLGEIDISIGSMMGLLATVIGQMTSPSRAVLPVIVGVVTILLLGSGLGSLNGLLVTVGKMPSIIVTLSMMTILQGVNLALMNGQWITDLPSGLRFFGIGTALGIPICLWTALVVVILSVLLTRETPLGRRIYAAGSNADAARLAGISSSRLKLFAFTLTGFLTAVATLVSVPRLSVIETGIGNGFELLVVTCVVVGGTRISGGRGAILGSVLAALLLGLVRPMLIFLHLGVSATYWEKAVQGAFILVAVLADQMSRSSRGTAGSGGASQPRFSLVPRSMGIIYASLGNGSAHSAHDAHRSDRRDRPFRRLDDGNWHEQIQPSSPFLSDAQRTRLRQLTTSGVPPARTLVRARLLLLADRSEGVVRSETQIAEAVGGNKNTVGNVKRRFASKGLDAVLSEKPRPGAVPKVTGEIEAQITRLALSDAPEGFARWTTRLLANKIVELGFLESLSHHTVAHTLKKTKASPPLLT